MQGTTDRIQILLEDATEVRVRPKDVALLHPGPVAAFRDLGEASRDAEGTADPVEEAWEVVLDAGQEATTNLAELAELCFGRNTPAAAWAAWRAVAEGVYFEGEPDCITALPRDEVQRRLSHRRTEAEEKEARRRFLAHARSGRLEPEDDRFVQELEGVALSKATRSKLLRELDRPDSPEGAHGLLLDLGCWAVTRNPHPARLRAHLKPPSLPYTPQPGPGGRCDLTFMEAFAIDDEGTTTPDDAVSFHQGQLWVHIADPAGFLRPDGDLDMEARRRAETLHLPECVVHMLPLEAIHALGLGIGPTSPALSVRLEMDADGNAVAAEMEPTTVRVTRVTYAEAEQYMDRSPLREVLAAVGKYRAQRERRGAFTLELPEARITVGPDGGVSVVPLDRPSSRLMVQEAMIMTGQAIARWAADRGLPLPFSIQEGSQAAAELAAQGKAPLSQLWAARRTLRRSARTLSPGKHAGLGVEPYCQATSPLRRYLDLVVHHQVRAALAGHTPLAPEDVTRRIGEVEAVVPSLRLAEQLSERHWTLVYLVQNPDWTGEAVVLDQRGRNLTVMVPSLALEAEVHTRKPVEPDGVLRLRVQEIRLPLLEVHFSVV